MVHINGHHRQPPRIEADKTANCYQHTLWLISALSDAATWRDEVAASSFTAVVTSSVAVTFGGSPWSTHLEDRLTHLDDLDDSLANSWTLGLPLSHCRLSVSMTRLSHWCCCAGRRRTTAALRPVGRCPLAAGARRRRRHEQQAGECHRLASHPDIWNKNIQISRVPPACRGIARIEEHYFLVLSFYS